MELDQAYKSILDNINTPIFLCNPAKDILYINPAAERLTGWSLLEAVSKKCDEIFGGDEQICEAGCPADGFNPGKGSRLQHQGNLQTRAGESIHFKALITPIYGEDHLVARVVEMQAINDVEAPEPDDITTRQALKKEIKERWRAEDALWK
ncbi:MAG: PAS domain-containing protein, partial [Desulfobacterales bacterium]|nr:PAS domain-containing protein [Desulfobacterales bacterium]